MGCLAQGVEHLICNWFSPEFELYQKLPLFPLARKFTLIAKYWLVQGTDMSVIYNSKIVSFTIKLELMQKKQHKAGLVLLFPVSYSYKFILS